MCVRRALTNYFRESQQIVALILGVATIRKDWATGKTIKLMF